jgi:hypothetical protein
MPLYKKHIFFLTNSRRVKQYQIVHTGSNFVLVASCPLIHTYTNVCYTIDDG